MHGKFSGTHCKCEKNQGCLGGDLKECMDKYKVKEFKSSNTRCFGILYTEKVSRGLCDHKALDIQLMIILWLQNVLIVTVKEINMHGVRIRNYHYARKKEILPFMIVDELGRQIQVII